MLKKHQQADSDNGVKPAVDFPVFDIFLNSVYLPGICVNTGDGRRAGFHGQYAVTAPAGLEAEIAKPGTQVEDFTFKIFKRQFFERVQCEFVVPDLLLELGFEEPDGMVVGNRAFFHCEAKYRFTAIIERQSSSL